MKEYGVNRGVLRPLEFKGLRAAYIGLAMAGVVVAFALYIALSFASTALAVSVLVILSAASVGLAFYLNSRFGTTGLSQLAAQMGCVGAVYQNRRMRRFVRVGR